MTTPIDYDALAEHVTDDPAADRLRNYRVEDRGGGDKPNLVRVGLAAEQIAAALRARAGDWPRRVGKMLFAREGDEPLWLDDADALFAWAGRRFAGGEANPIDWAAGSDKLTPGRFLAHLRQTATAHEGVERLPHYPPLPGHYYCHPDVTPGDGSALAWLLGRFCPATPVDRDLIKAFFLSLFWGGRPGSRPAWLVTGKDDDPHGGRGIGKTHLPMAGGELAGDLISVSPNDQMEDVKKRLFSEEGRLRRVVVMDNVKTLKLSWNEFEDLVTAKVISGRALFVGEGRRPNTLTWVITLNGASLSRDVAQRCIPIVLDRPVYDATWWQTTAAYIEQHRWQIIGDIAAEFARPALTLADFSRWGSWEMDVLARVADPVACQITILDRQNAMDADQDELHLVRDAFAAELRRRGHDPDCDTVFVPNRTVAEVLEKATGERRPTNRATAYLRTLGMAELRKSARDGERGFVWTGRAAPAGQSAAPLWDEATIPP